MQLKLCMLVTYLTFPKTSSMFMSIVVMEVLVFQLVCPLLLNTDIKSVVTVFEH
jgi:hypothetical protein